MNKLFLDDIRQPPDNTWIVVRNFNEFKNHILKHGIPDMISFDHDLGDTLQDGYYCVKWLINMQYEIKDYTVHSANPVGTANIIGLIENWKKFTKENKNE